MGRGDCRASTFWKTLLLNGSGSVFFIQAGCAEAFFTRLSPTLPSRQIPSQRCWFLSCDHYGNLASFLLLIYDLVNMPACQMVLFFRLGDNEINKNCCKKQRGEVFALNGPLFIPTNGLPRPQLQCSGALSRWRAQWSLGGPWEASSFFQEAPCALEFSPRKRHGITPPSSETALEPTCPSTWLLTALTTLSTLASWLLIFLFLCYSVSSQVFFLWNQNVMHKAAHGVIR